MWLTPIALQTALTMAGGTPLIATSPAPFPPCGLLGVIVSVLDTVNIGRFDGLGDPYSRELEFSISPLSLNVILSMRACPAPA
jgi:hypothetical protein